MLDQPKLDSIPLGVNDALEIGKRGALPNSAKLFNSAETLEWWRLPCALLTPAESLEWWRLRCALLTPAVRSLACNSRAVVSRVPQQHLRLPRHASCVAGAEQVAVADDADVGDAPRAPPRALHLRPRLGRRHRPTHTREHEAAARERVPDGARPPPLRALTSRQRPRRASHVGGSPRRLHPKYAPCAAHPHAELALALAFARMQMYKCMYMHMHANVQMHVHAHAHALMHRSHAYVHCPPPPYCIWEDQHPQPMLD